MMRKSNTLLVAIAATVLMLVFLAPMRSVLLWATMMSVIVGTMNERLAVRFASRSRAALASIGVVVLCLLVPMIAVSALLTEQVASIVARRQELAADISSAFRDGLALLPTKMATDIQHAITAFDWSKITGFMAGAANYLLHASGNFLVVGGQLLAALYLAYFFLRDREQILDLFSSMVPLDPADQTTLKQRLAETAIATFRGTLLVAAAQSAIAGAVYAALGLNIFAVLALLTFIACLIPAIGSGLVWVPVALYFFFSGDFIRGGIMLASGILVIGMVDNVLRPKLIASRTTVPDYVIFVTSFGGLALIGFDGLFIGPLVACLFLESWRLNTRHRAEERLPGQGPGGSDAPQG
ncbi:AI-2E family transporter [Novosphingobium sp. ZN18A2]|uniref:AI-2E family transporter n=1 Tax=Novosphingobium sp. ZN18A2 TaxID=3079861 RepID=UPI0030D2540A